MATYFGEVIERSSRALWGDDDDSGDDICSKEYLTNNRNLEVSNTTNLPTSKAKLFLIAHGPLTGGFIEACCLDKGEPIAEINESEQESAEEEKSFQKRKRKPSAIYRLSSDVLLCVCSVHLDISQSFDFTEKISPWMRNSNQVIVLTCSYNSEYHAPRNQIDSRDAFIKSLSTDLYSSSVLSETLEQPNKVQGVPAGILTWCQAFKVPAVLYICYTRSYEVDSNSVKLFVELSSKFPFKILKEKPNFTQKLYAGPELTSNLYM